MADNSAYLTVEEFFSTLRVAFDDTYGNDPDHRWHPEDLYINVTTTLEIVSNALNSLHNIRNGKYIGGIKRA